MKLAAAQVSRTPGQISARIERAEKAAMLLLMLDKLCLTFATSALFLSPPVQLCHS